MGTIGVGIVGCGMIAHFHARALAEIRGVKLRAVHTSKLSNGQSVVSASGTSADIYHDLDEMLARDDIDLVCICTPSGAHLEPGIAAARAKKHVIVEKPLEVTLKRCDALMAACKQAKVQLGTIFPSRFSDANIELKKAITQGRFGRITLADSTVKWWRPQSYYDSGGWRGTWKLDGGGALMNQAIHNVDLLYHLMGPVEQVSAFTSLLAHERIEVEDTAVAILKFASRAIGSITATTSAYPGLLKTIAVHGDKGSAVIEQDSILTWEFAKPTAGDAKIREKLMKSSALSGGASDPKAISHQGHARQLADFVRAIRSKETSAVGGDEGRHAVEIIQAIYQSQATGKVVKLPLAKDPRPPKLTS
ncbi:Gfo/Idh/MocA family oxidoreductase [bacterium]|nr:Gfo/Idh/MocA family oxidoreductase [bacterium]